jgi:hypothetical protein
LQDKFAGQGMQKALKIDHSMRAVMIAIAAAIAVAVLAMLVPTAIWETLTGSTGISEIIPATAAPLGDTARALIAFCCGLTAFAVALVFALRRPAAKVKPVAVATPDAPGFVETIKARLAAFAEQRRGSGPVIKDLADLPKLRPGDAHPDAPPRRPISANADFGPLITDGEMPPVVKPAEIVAVPEVNADAPVVETPAPASIPAVSALLDRLEVAVAQREEQLKKLEALAIEQAELEPEPPAPPLAEPVEAEIIIEAKPHLEAVPASGAKIAKDDMDDALRSALETLQRMNARTR